MRRIKFGEQHTLGEEGAESTLERAIADTAAWFPVAEADEDKPRPECRRVSNDVARHLTRRAKQRHDAIIAELAASLNCGRCGGLGGGAPVAIV
jgi:hypothetical protein